MMMVVLMRMIMFVMIKLVDMLIFMMAVPTTLSFLVMMSVYHIA